MDEGTDRMRVAMVPTSQGDRASVRTPAMSNGRSSVPSHRCQDPHPLSPEECGKHGFETSFDFCMCMLISSSVQF